MPLTSKGKKIMSAMTLPESEGGYGAKKGKEVFYASQNKGTIKGTHKTSEALPVEYVQGFVDKCASRGIDPEVLIKSSDVK